MAIPNFSRQSGPSPRPARLLPLLLPFFVVLNLLSDTMRDTAQAQLLHEPNLELLAQQQARAASKAFTSKAGRFAIAFSKEPRIETEQDDIEGAPIKIHSFSVERRSDAYIVAYTDMPEAYLRKGKQAVLNEISRTVMTDFNLGELVASGTNTRLASHPGKIFRINSDELTLDARFYLVDERMYLLLAASEQPQSVAQFIQSFNLL